MKSELIYRIIIDVLADEATESDKQTFHEWLAMSERNVQEFNQIKHLYELSTQLGKKKEPSFQTDAAWEKVRRRASSKQRKIRLYRWAPLVAASTIIFCFLSIYFYNSTTSNDTVGTVAKLNEPTLFLGDSESINLAEDNFTIKNEGIVIKNTNQDKQLSYVSGSSTTEDSEEKTDEVNRLVVPKGKTYQLQLADGTRVWMNAESQLTFPAVFEKGVRKVTLRGEAYFEVAKDAKKPFILQIADLEIRVLGTSFNASAYPNERSSSVTLVEGSVAVSQNKKECARLTPSQLFEYNNQTKEQNISTVDVQKYISWRNGVYIFNNTTLADIFIKLEHWHQFALTCSDPSLLERRFSFSIDRNTKIEKILEVINYTSNVKCEIKNHIINIKQ